MELWAVSCFSSVLASLIISCVYKPLADLTLSASTSRSSLSSRNVSSFRRMFDFRSPCRRASSSNRARLDCSLIFSLPSRFLSRPPSPASGLLRRTERESLTSVKAGRLEKLLDPPCLKRYTIKIHYNAWRQEPWWGFQGSTVVCTSVEWLFECHVLSNSPLYPNYMGGGGGGGGGQACWLGKTWKYIYIRYFSFNRTITPKSLKQKNPRRRMCMRSISLLGIYRQIITK